MACEKLFVNCTCSYTTHDSIKANKIIDFRCTQCGQRFIKELELKKHVLRRHRNNTQPSNDTLRAVKPRAVEDKPLVNSNEKPQKLIKAFENGGTLVKQEAGQLSFECRVCIRSFCTERELEEHRQSAEHKQAAIDLFRDDDIVQIEREGKPLCPMMQEVLDLHKQCKLVEAEIERLMTPVSEDDKVPQRKVETEPSSPCVHIPQGYPLTYDFIVDEQETSVQNKEETSISGKTIAAPVHSVEKCSSEDTAQNSTEKARDLYFNEAHIVGTVNKDLQCTQRGPDPVIKFSVLVRRPVHASAIRQEENTNSDPTRIMEEEAFSIECRGQKWCDFAKSSIREGVIVSVHGRLSMRPQFHEIDGSYTYNAVTEVNVAEGNIEILMSNANLC